MKSNQATKKSPSEPGNRNLLIEPLRRNTVSQFFSEEDLKRLQERIKKAVVAIAKQ